MMKINRVVGSLCLIMLLALGLWSDRSEAVSDKNQNTNANANTVNVRTPKSTPRTAQVRIGLKMTPYQPVTVKTKEGKSVMKSQPAGTLQHTLRARIERTNHFYFGDWHVETIPEAWSRESMKYRVKLRFFKRFGEGKDLEEMVGSTTVQGTLEGKNYLYAMNGQVSNQFKNRNGDIVLAVVVGSPSSKKDAPTKERLNTKTEPVAKNKTSTGPAPR